MYWIAILLDQLLSYLVTYAEQPEATCVVLFCFCFFFRCQSKSYVTIIIGQRYVGKLHAFVVLAITHPATR
ncbi:hypothetical protein BP00DRAFT_203130 [Aspergillus indologenus CBS 114.80]|uniref:Secreted protein n=1 Tax=Aspergillus indologenus CBS 114.80 TaxID=1450541 RepID=A0A2V5I128_9EURO|nr:hypothetical protein BP00DRAFT_203130 [Aspergillus indologenus CBS 114.80]